MDEFQTKTAPSLCRRTRRISLQQTQPSIPQFDASRRGKKGLNIIRNKKSSRSSHEQKINEGTRDVHTLFKKWGGEKSLVITHHVLLTICYLQLISDPIQAGSELHVFYVRKNRNLKRKKCDCCGEDILYSFPLTPLNPPLQRPLFSHHPHDRLDLAPRV